MLSLVVESWIWYTFATALVFARLGSRALLFRSVKKLQLDDWLMVLTLATYTTLIVTINIVAHQNSNLLPPGFDMSSLTDTEVRDRQYGSKLVLVVEQCQILTIWLVKACLLIMYHRITIPMKENLYIKLLAAYVAIGFVVMEILYFGVWCRPFQNYWAVPTPNTQCNAATNHLITNAVFNISSDLAMLIIAVQMIIRTNLPLQRKAILCLIFGLAVFSILSAVLNKYYSFSQPFSTMWTFWYVRESSTAILVANLPFTWTLLRRVFKLAAFDPNASAPPERPRYHSSRTAGGRRNYPVIMGQFTRTQKNDGTGGGSGNGSVTGTFTGTHHSGSSGSTGHRGGGRRAGKGGADKGRAPSRRPKGSKSRKHVPELELASWMEDSLSSRSDKACDHDQGSETRIIPPFQRAFLPPEEMV